MGPPAAGLPGNRHGSPLRRLPGWLLPLPIRGIDSDNASAFINQRLTPWCAEREVEFPRSRAYCKSGLARIVRWKAAVVRRFAGLHRYSGRLAGHTMVHLYRAVRLYVIYFPPFFKLLVKTREGY